MMNFSAFKNRQWYLLSGICSFLIGGVVVYGVVSMRETKFQQGGRGLKSSLTTGSSRINPQQAWVHKFTNEADITNKRLDAMEGMLTRVLKLNESARAGIHEPSTHPKNLSTQQAALIGDVRHVLKSEQIASQANLVSEQANSKGDILLSSGQVLPSIPGLPAQGNARTASTGEMGQGGTLSNPSPPFRSKGLRKISLSLKNARSSAPLKTVDNMIPAGAFAKAVLLGGVDASVSIQASSDPRPALLRITDLGTLPRKFYSDLEGCHALAACYGDISSERVYMRLEKLTCTERKTGEIVEVKVQGYVAGEDGRAGVRGSVVDRAGESMRNAMMGGFLGGVGDFLSQSRNPVAFSPIAGLAQTNPMGARDMLKHGAGKGVGNALDKYADFYIKRAEQVQPVLQVSAGRQVDMVFTEGVSIGDSIYRQAVGRSHDQERYQQIRSVTEEGRWSTSSQGLTPIRESTPGLELTSFAPKPVSTWSSHSANTSNEPTMGTTQVGIN